VVDRVIDFRVRPPARGFLRLHLYAEPGRSKRITERIGLTVPPSAASQDMDLLLKEMDGAGVRIGVVAARQSAPHYGTVTDEDAIAIARDYPDRFVAFASVGPDFDSPGVAAASGVAARRDRGTRGVALDPGFAVTPLFCDDRRLYPVYEACDAAEMPILMTLSGNVGPTIEYSHPIHLDRVARDFPRLSLIAGHGAWPWVQEILGVAYRRQNVYVLPDLYLINFPGSQDYIRAANYWMQDQFLFGSSYPFASHHDAIENLFRLGLSDRSAEKTVWHNAARLLRLE
jgi:predicted TIM-barrel fold metal-dependent hydrolase